MKAWDKGYFRQHDFLSFRWLYKDAVCFLPQNSGLGQAWNFKSQQSVKFDGGLGQGWNFKSQQSVKFDGGLGQGWNLKSQQCSQF